MFSQKSPTKLNAHSPWNPPVTLNWMPNRTHTHTHTHTAQTPEDCSNVPDYCIAANLEPINSNFPLKDIPSCSLDGEDVTKQVIFVKDNVLHATVKTTEQSVISSGRITELYIHETGKSTSKAVQSHTCMINKT